ncbi:MAG: hypothetical protein HKN30_05935 [Sulfitobacter sp.]|nr:hypothetical protein [Sulfitobacter sp.]
MADRKNTAIRSIGRAERSQTTRRSPRVQSVALPTIVVLVLCLIAAMTWQSRNAPANIQGVSPDMVKKETLD